MDVTKIVFLVAMCALLLEVECRRTKLSRQKRYVAFPEGASFSGYLDGTAVISLQSVPVSAFLRYINFYEDVEAVYCLTFQMGITDGARIFTEGINWGLVYDLPNDTKPFIDGYGPALKRRNRRDLYNKVENILTSMGYNGRSCILRSLCEATNYFKSREDSLLHHLLALIFRYPKEPIESNEPDDHRVYHWAAHMAKDSLLQDDSSVKDCSDIFYCPFSLIDLALGHYSRFDDPSDNSIDPS